MPTFLHDARYGIRSLTRTPGFTAIAVAVLALGIGVNSAIFSLANALLLRPLPVMDPGSVVRVYSNRYSNTRYRTYVELAGRNSTLVGLAGFQLQSFGLRLDGDVEHAFGEIVSGNYFPVLGVTAAHGRLLVPADDRPDAPPAVVLSYAFWTRRFGASRDAVGRTIAINGQPFTVVGVADERFPGVLAPLRGDLWVPLAADALLRPALDAAARLDASSLHLVGRLRPGVELERAAADLDTIGRQVRAAAGNPDRGPAVTVYRGTVLHPEISTPVSAFVVALMTVVALVLLIVCVNVANLVLARAAGRGVELAVRQSLGAGRKRLVAQLLTENLLLSLAGAAGGIGIAWGCTRLVAAARIPAPVPVALDASIDLRVLAFTVALAVAATLAFGLVPALAASRGDLVPALKGIAGEGPRHGRLRSAFLVAQVALSVLLLVVAGLFVRGFRQAQSIDPGFDTAHVLTAMIDLETRGYDAARGSEVVRSIAERIAAVPGVVSVNVVDTVPLTLSNTTANMRRDGDPVPPPGERPSTPEVYVNGVGPGHFSTLEIALLAGRDFTYQDGDSAPRVAIANETLARTFWPGKSAVGQRLHPLDAGPGARPIEIVGVVRDSQYLMVGEAPRPFLYQPLAQAYTPHVTLLVRGAGSPASVLPAVTTAVGAVDPALPVFNVAPLAEVTSVSLVPARVAGLLLGALGTLALALAALGIYGVLSCVVGSRTREIGVRVALGASPGAVAGMVVRQAIAWTGVGAAIGLGLALGLTRFLTAFLYGISPTDPLTLAGVAALLGLVSGIAALVPAVRATRLDPLAALRSS